MDKEDLLNLNNNPNKNTKKILIYGAAAFLVFVIGVIIFALTGGNKDNTEVIPPQVKEEPLFKELPIEKETKVKNEEKPQNSEVSEVKQQKAPQKQITKTIKEKPEKNEVKKEEKPKPQKEIKQVKKTVTPHKKIKHQALGKYYIQVAAFLKYKHPNKKFLQLIKKYGYKYIIYPVTIDKNGKKIKINKLLIGPFHSKNEVRKELVKVKKHITQNAFVFKVK